MMEKLNMVAIARVGASTYGSTRMPARAAPNLEAQVRTFRAQLADWVTCPSAKTPEGKAKIEQITAKLDSVKDQIKTQGKKAEVASPSAKTSPTRSVDNAVRQADSSIDALGASARLGSYVDTFA